MTAIKTNGYSRSSEQRVFSGGKNHDWIFDYPGVFYDKGYKLEDVSFKEENAGIINLGLLSVTGNVSYFNQNLGRLKLGSTTSSFFWLTLTDLKNSIKEKNLPAISNEDEKVLEEKLAYSLGNWANLRRTYNRENTGIPAEIYMEFENEGSPTPIIRVGLENLAYLPMHQDKPAVFATPYFITGRANLLDKVKAVCNIFKTNDSVKLGKSSLTKTYLPRLNFTKSELKGTGPAEYEVKLTYSFKELREYALTCPTVPRDGISPGGNAK